MKILPRDWYFPAARARLCRRIASVIIIGVVVGTIIGGLSARGIVLDDLALLARDGSPVVRPLVREPLPLRYQRPNRVHRATERRKR